MTDTPEHQPTVVDHATAPAQQAVARGGGKGRMIVAAILGVVAVLGAAFVVVNVVGDDDAGAEVTLQSLGSSGPDAFTDPVAEQPSISLAEFAENGRPEGAEVPEPQTGTGSGGYRTVDGTLPGVFGGTLDERACNAEQLVAFLQTDDVKAAAWASVIGIDPADIATYVDGLTATNLGRDTRVLDHGFVDGEPDAREAVLQRGTAVLVDARGVPRVNCYSGNPLRNPTVVDDEEFVGDPWAEFETTEVLIISPSTDDTDEFTLFDVETGRIISRPAGSTGEADVDPAAVVEEPVEEEVIEPEETPTASPTRPVSEGGAFELGASVTAELTEETTELVYEFEAPDSATLTLTVANDRASIGRVAAELSENGEQIEFFRTNAGGTETFDYTLDHDDGGTFELTFTEGPGVFEFQVTAAIQDDAGQGADAGDDFGTAFEISSGDEVTGSTADRDLDDLYLLELGGGQELVVTRRNARESDQRIAFDIALEGESLDFERVNQGGEEVVSILLGPEDDGTLEIRAFESAARYTFIAELIDQADGGDDGDAGNELADARTLDELDDIDGQVGERDDSDWFLFETSAAEHTIEASVDATSDRRVAFEIRDADGNGVAFFRVNPGADATETFEATPGETYQLIVTEGRGTYSISIS